jgi:hypothetical protein
MQDIFLPALPNYIYNEIRLPVKRWKQACKKIPLNSTKVGVLLVFVHVQCRIYGWC